MNTQQHEYCDHCAVEIPPYQSTVGEGLCHGCQMCNEEMESL